MNRLLLCALCCLLPACVIVVDKDGLVRRGSGHRAQETRTTEAFHGVEFRGAGELEVTVGAKRSLWLSGDADLLSEVVTEVKDGELIIHYPGELRFRRTLRVQVGTPTLHALRVLGSGDAELHHAQGEKLTLLISGSGDLEANGEVEQLQAKISGAGSLELDELATEHAVVTISGSGDARLRVAEELRYTISGSGDIAYSGAARTTGRISGSGSVKRR